jgi:pheromone shutdown protein TraB
LSVIVEKLKQRDLIISLMGILRAELPSVYDALVGERDSYMAESIDGSSGKLMVCVVGMAHMNGIENNLISRNYKVTIKNCPSS